MADNLKIVTPDPADESIVRIVTGNLRVLEKTNEFIYKVELSLLDDRTNRNDWRYENLEEHAHLFAETPILCAFIGDQVGDGHNFTMRRDKETGEEYASFLAPTAERIVGYIPANGNVSVVERDGNKWIVAQGQLWTWYAHELVEKIARQGRMEVSIETLIDKMHMDGSTEVFEKYQILGTTILGDGVAPAVAGAGIKALAEAKDACKELNIKAASYVEQQPKKTEKDQSKRSVRTMSKLALSDIQEKFTDYRVLAASEDGLHIALLDNKGCACAYTFASKEDTAAVIPERIVKVGAKVPITFEDGTEIAVDASEFTSPCMEELATVKTSLNAVSSELESAKAEVATMKEFEAKRRVQAAKDAAKRALEAINADRCAEEQIGCEVLDEVNAAADNGDFAECYDADGCWNGEEKACAALKAACMDIVTSMDKAKAEAARKVNALSVMGKERHDVGGIDSLLDRING